MDPKQTTQMTPKLLFTAIQNYSNNSGVKYLHDKDGQPLPYSHKALVDSLDNLKRDIAKVHFSESAQVKTYIEYLVDVALKAGFISMHNTFNYRDRIWQLTSKQPILAGDSIVVIATTKMAETQSLENHATDFVPTEFNGRDSVAEQYLSVNYHKFWDLVRNDPSIWRTMTGYGNDGTTLVQLLISTINGGFEKYHFQKMKDTFDNIGYLFSDSKQTTLDATTPIPNQAQHAVLPAKLTDTASMIKALQLITAYVRSANFPNNAFSTKKGDNAEQTKNYYLVYDAPVIEPLMRTTSSFVLNQVITDLKSLVKEMIPYQFNNTNRRGTKTLFALITIGDTYSGDSIINVGQIETTFTQVYQNLATQIRKHEHGRVGVNYYVNSIVFDRNDGANFDSYKTFITTQTEEAFDGIKAVINDYQGAGLPVIVTNTIDANLPQVTIDVPEGEAIRTQEVVTKKGVK